MLQTLRDKTSSWIAPVILTLLTIPFAFFGIDQYMSQRVETWVARVEAPPTWWKDAPHWWPASMLWQRQDIDAQDFRQRYDTIRQEQRQQQGESFDNRAFESVENKRQILDSLIDERVLQMAADRAGIAVGDQQVVREIQKFPAFQVDGKFNPERYQLALASQVPQRTPAQFEALVRESLQQSLLPDQLGQSAFVTKAELDRVLKLLGETRAVSYVQLPPPAPDTGPVAGKEIDAWYKSHQAEYRAPEMVSIEYVDIDAAALPVPPADEATLRQRYEQEKSRFAGQEERLASHILISVPKDADAATQKAAEQKANQLAAQARAPGADFAALAKSASDDNLSKASGGDLGWVSRNVMAKPFEDALFAMKAGEVRGPIKTDFGWHIIQLREVRTPQQVPFEQVREQLVRDQADADREHAFNELTGKLVDLVYKNPTALTPAAQELKLPVQTLGPFPRGGGTGIAANPALQRAAFSETLIQDGTVSDPIELAPNHSVLIRVTQHTPERTQPLAQVRDRVVAAIRADRANKAALAKADAIVERVRKGESLQQVAASQQLAAVDLPSVPRGAPFPDPKATEAYFQVPPPAPGKASPGRVVLGDGSVVVFAVSGVTSGDPAKATAEQRQLLQQQLARAGGADDARAFVSAMRKQMQVKVAEDRL
jgi:peptidyl-prolyl cis-trans isomerase D